MLSFRLRLLNILVLKKKSNLFRNFAPENHSGTPEVRKDKSSVEYVGVNFALSLHQIEVRKSQALFGLPNCTHKACVC